MVELGFDNSRNEQTLIQIKTYHVQAGSLLVSGEAP